MGLWLRLYETTPRQWLRAARRRLAPRRAAGFSLEDLLEKRDALRPQKFTDFFGRYERIVRRHRPDSVPLDFGDKVVLELGSGPLLGFAPLAVFFGCRRYVCVDPTLDKAVLSHPVLRERYFSAIYDDLTAMHGPRQSLEAFLASLSDSIVPVQSIEHLPTEPGIDIVLSNSCLEHIDDLAATLAALRGRCYQRATHLHLVDFGNHRRSPHPFSDVYEQPPEDYQRRFGRGINLMRGTDVVKSFQQAGFPAVLIRYYDAERTYHGTIHPWWQERYARADLFLKAGIIYVPPEGRGEQSPSMAR